MRRPAGSSTPPMPRGTVVDRVFELSEDRLLGGRVLLRQPISGYRAAIDPVLLAAAVAAAPAARVVELGCGVGAAMLCLAARRADLVVTGVERDNSLVTVARDNIAVNGWSTRLNVVVSDVRYARAVVPRENIDGVMMNPPFLEAARADPSPQPDKRAATVESDTTLADWIDAGLSLLEPGGTLTLIQRADRLGEALAALRRRAGAVVVFPLWPKAGEPAKRVLVQARLGRRTPLTLAAGLVLHEADGQYTAAAQSVLRDGAALAL